MTRDEYNALFHKHQLNLVAFKRLNDCDEDVLRLVNAAILTEREACAKVCDGLMRGYWVADPSDCAEAIRARGQA